MIVMSWNILAEPLVESPMCCRMNKIIRILRSFHADIVFLQEVTSAARRVLQMKLGKTYFVGELAAHDQSEWRSGRTRIPYGNLTMVRREFGRIRKHQTKTEWHRWGTAFDLNWIAHGNQVIATANLHLDSSNHRTRNEELRALLRHWNPQTDRIMVAGDFNSDGTDLRNRMLRSGFSHANSFSDITCVEDDKAIDFIYATVPTYGEAFAISMKESGSDHYPVVAAVNFHKSSFRTRSA